MAGDDRQAQDLVQALVPVADADVAEHDTGVAAREDLETDVGGDAVGERDRALGVGEGVGVRAGEEVQLSLDRGEFGGGGVVLGERLGFSGQRDGALQVAALEHDGGLEHERAATQRSVVERAGDLVAADRFRQGGVVVLVVEVPRAIKRPVDLDRITGGHQVSVRLRARGT